MQLTVRDAARLLGVPEETLERWVRRGELPAERVDDRYRFNRVELLEFAVQHQLPVSAEILEDPRAPAAVRLASAVRVGGIHRGLRATEKEGLLREMVDRLPAPPGFDRDFLYRMILAREHLGSTALCSGVAIPHPREPIVLRVGQPAAAIFFPDVPADFGSADGQPVHTLCLLVCPSTRTHLLLLATLAAALRDPAVVQRLAERAPDEEILAAFDRVERERAQRRAESIARGDRA
jgi:PTS system nitrogen regulatory IIA component